MRYDHTTTGLHRADLDRAIETLRLERLLASAAAQPDGLRQRARRRIGGALIALGTTLVGHERTTLRAHRA